VTVIVTVLGIPDPDAPTEVRVEERFGTRLEEEFLTLPLEVPRAVKMVGKGGRNGRPSFSKLVG
jgi:hypothetical protein